jgi:hypothetical protein
MGANKDRVALVAMGAPELAMRHRTDNSHASIVQGLRGAGLLVIDLSGVGGGCPDILCAFNGAWHLIEVKSLDTAYGRRGLSERQRHLALLAGSAPVHVVVDLESALRAIGATDEG